MIYFTIDFTQRNADLANPFVNVLKAIVFGFYFTFSHIWIYCLLE